MERIKSLGKLLKSLTKLGKRGYGLKSLLKGYPCLVVESIMV